MIEKIKMLKDARGSDNGIKVQLYKKGEIYEIGESLSKSFISSKNARYVQPRFYYKFKRYILTKARTLIRDIKKWYKGEYVIPDRSDYGGVVIIGPHLERSVIAANIEKTIKWCKSHWQFLIGTTIAIIGLFIAS